MLSKDDETAMLLGKIVQHINKVGRKFSLLQNALLAKGIITAEEGAMPARG